MTDNGWRTVLIESKSELSVSDECLIIKSEGQTREIAINQIGSVVLCNHGTVLTTASLTASSFNRFVTVYGYNTSLGIKHSNGQNPYNLSCDLMEPFRPVVDRFVYQNRGRELDIFYKREMVALMYEKIELDGKYMTVNSAVEQFTKGVLNSLSANHEAAEDISIGA